MGDIRSVLSQFHSKKKATERDVQKTPHGPPSHPSYSEIPDVFFDEILPAYKLNRPEISLLMLLYRQVWNKPNLYRSHGIGPLNSYSEICTLLNFTHEELGNYLRVLEKYNFIETVRSGQYFVRKYFTEDLDAKFDQDYDQFF